MNVYFYNLEVNTEMELDSGDILAVETNNMRFFRNLLRDLKGIAAEKSEVALFNKGKPMIHGKDYLLLVDYYDTEIISKAINSKVLKKISAEVEKDASLYLEYNEHLSGLYSFVLSVIEQNNITFESSSEKPFEDVLKLFSVAVELPRNDMFLKMLNLIEVIGTLHLFNAIILVNGKSFFTDNELCEICKLTKYLEISLLLVDNKITDRKITDEELLMVDEDFFEIKK